RRHTRCYRDWSSDVCSSDLELDYGVAAICGGMCSCATCHVYVDPEWQSRLPEMMSDERELLSELTHYQQNSRLSCQVEFTPELEIGRASCRETESEWGREAS